LRRSRSARSGATAAGATTACFFVHFEFKTAPHGPDTPAE